jgi:hypothetical protein
VRLDAGFLALQATITLVRVEDQPELFLGRAHQCILLSSHACAIPRK